MYPRKIKIKLIILLVINPEIAKVKSVNEANAVNLSLNRLSFINIIIPSVILLNQSNVVL